MALPYRLLHESSTFRRKSLSIFVALANAPCSIVAMLLLLSRTRVRLAHDVKLEARIVVRRFFSSLRVSSCARLASASPISTSWLSSR